MDPSSTYGDSGRTVKDQLDQLSQRRDDLKGLVQPGENLLETMPDQDVVTYLDRRKMFGEVAAMGWVINKYGKQ